MLRAHRFGSVFKGGNFCGLCAGHGQLGQAKIQNLGVATLGDEYICRFDIAMNDAFGVRGIQSVGEFNGLAVRRTV